MDDHYQKTGNIARYVWSLLVGLLVGALSGAVAMMLLSPQSGKETRAEIRQKSIELRDHTVKTVEGAVAQARGMARQMTDDVHKQAGELQQRGQDLLDERRVSKTPKDAGEAVDA